MADRTHKASEGLVNDIKTAVHGFTGTGDAIRGTVNSTMDGIFHNKQSDESRAKNDEIARHGFADMHAAEQKVEQDGHGHTQGQSHSTAGTHFHKSSGQGSHFSGH